MSADVINKMPLWHMYCIINFALDVGIAYGYNACGQHFPAASKGYSSGATGDADQKLWADRVEECYVKDPDYKKHPKKSIGTAYWTVAEEYCIENGLPHGNGEEIEIFYSLRRWWHKFYPHRNGISIKESKKNKTLSK
jgi:hypothetical protein